MSMPFRRRVTNLITYRREKSQTLRKFPPWYPTTPSEKLIPVLPKDVRVKMKPVNFSTLWDKGADARLVILAEKMTLLFKYERLEMFHHVSQELRPYAERLIATAIRYGDCHVPTMELADFWLREKNLVHKLFKVLVPRFSSYTSAFTSIYPLAPRYEDAAKKSPHVIERMRIQTTPLLIQSRNFSYKERAILELKGNPLPPLRPPPPKNRLILTNILMNAAKTSSQENLQDPHIQLKPEE